MKLLALLKRKRKHFLLKDCPIGLFLFNNTLCIKTEYSDDNGYCDCYIISSGEYFVGGVIDKEKRNLLTVIPIKVKTVYDNK